MAVLKCKRCGRITNTTVSDFIDTLPDAKKCYAAVDDKTKRWVKGCAYKKASKTDKRVADRLLGNIATTREVGQTMGKIEKAEKEEPGYDELLS